MGDAAEIQLLKAQHALAQGDFYQSLEIARLGLQAQVDNPCGGLGTSEGQWRQVTALALTGLGQLKDAQAEWTRCLLCAPWPEQTAACTAQQARTHWLTTRPEAPASLPDLNGAFDPQQEIPAWDQMIKLALQNVDTSAGWSLAMDASLAWVGCAPDDAASWLSCARLWQLSEWQALVSPLVDKALLQIHQDPGILPLLREIYLSRGDSRACYEISRAQLEQNPDQFEALIVHIFDCINGCEWSRYHDLQKRLKVAIEQGAYLVGETALASSVLGPAEHLVAAQRWSAQWAGRSVDHRPTRHNKSQRPLVVGFLGADFFQQATSYLLTGVIEAWQREPNRFGIRAIAYDNGPNDHSAFRQRIEAAYADLVPVHGLSDEAVARQMERDQLDVLVLIKGISTARMGVMALRPAPVNVFYLYYPGTSGAHYIDYLIADETVIPPAHEGFYTEHIVRLGRCYQPNDACRPLVDPAYRSDAGLPQDSFVLANFNQCYKLTPQVFNAWCTILRTCPNTVLWLLKPNDWACANLLSQLQAQGLSPDRLVWGESLDVMSHLKRLGCADLLLDTHPYGAHTGASDALWAGVPVLTQIGETFASRVAASLLTEIGLPMLICRSLSEYVDTAIQAAQGQLPLSKWRAHIREQRQGGRLFDTDGYAKDLASLMHRL